MFLSGLSKSYYFADGSQGAAGPFLILMFPANSAGPPDFTKGLPYRGLVRFVKLRQSGHFMVGTLDLTLKSRFFKIHLSGAYGADGLIRDVPPEVYALGVDMPKELHEKWNKGGGHNSVGSEAPDMDAWAKTFKWPASSYGRKSK